MANPLPIKITAIGGPSGRTKFDRGEWDHARYTIKPITIVSDDNNRSVVIDELVVRFRTWFFVDDRYELENSTPRAEIPNFLKNETSKNWDSYKEIQKLEDNLLNVGRKVKIKLSEFEHNNKKHSWRLLGEKNEENNYSLEVYNNYTLMMEDGKELNFNENNLTSLIRKAKIYEKEHENKDLRTKTYLNILTKILSDIDES
ncbi:MAG: hypothetical protein mread185_000487 [Mycoplasmataceae bacterium]|nr:MAG: hypothetical protein mread185_000487 [Mycoplasmataceae bacterium]